ncbi:hypothetical protein [Agathobaculum hominis]|mgnify:CR=1 FL=1|uniref:Uncharacterized protein n=1 Tax=Agathobaculum hominis TaxID=2763014 RepID=A0ABR7GQV4_9FIRM|nr:hypothetical protein [Agathobaculum hominis]MBC5696680.1 hypothetical protein [Agathobaculum hominis]
MAKNIASENIFDGLKGGPAAAQKAVSVQETTPAPVKPENEIKVTPRNDKNRTARAQIVLTPELKQRAVKVAQHTGVSFNELVNQLLEQYCAVVENNQD